MPPANRQLRLQSRPKGLLAPGDLQLIESPVAELTDGQALAHVKYLSIDPTMRVWMAADTYLPAVAIGEVMRAIGFAEVVESRHPNYKKGDRVMGGSCHAAWSVEDVRQAQRPRNHRRGSREDAGRN